MANQREISLFHVEQRDEGAARLVVGAAPSQSAPVQPRIFGNFLEHLGYSIQGGVQAQLLLNPAFFASPHWPNHHLPPADLAQLRENGAIAERQHLLSADERQAFAGWRPHLRATGFGLMVLDDELAYGIPLPWAVAPHGAGAGMQPGRVGQSLRLQPADGAAVLAQGIFPPHQRERTYVGYVWVKAIGAGTLQVALRRRSGSGPRELLVVESLPWPGEHWTKIEFSLMLPDASLRPLEPVDFCVIAAGGGQLWVDKASLMPADHVEGLDPAMLAQIRSLAPPILRWPGGNFTSTYHFWDGIGPQDQRQTYPNIDWGGIDDNSFGISEFLGLCALVETEPHLCVNMGSGTAAEAAAWVEYVNGGADTPWGARRAADGHPEPWNVRLWEVGNEIYGVWQTGHCGPEENARRYKEWAEAMLAVDPTLELIATGNHQDFIEPHHHWNETLLREGGPHMGCIALHALPGNAQRMDKHSSLYTLWNDLMAHPHRWESVDLPDLLALARALAPDRNVDLAITEWGILGDTQRPQVGNLGGAIYAALFLNMAIRMQEDLRVANATALLHGGSLRKAGPFHYEDPQVEVIRRYTRLQGGLRLPIAYAGPTYDVHDGAGNSLDVTAVPWIDGVAVQAANGNVTLALVNRHAANALDVTLALPNAQGLVADSFEIMTGHMREMNTPVDPQRVRFVAQPVPGAGAQLQMSLPARSIGWLHLSTIG
jgi:alpha-N-arabinofuranosidase